MVALLQNRQGLGDTLKAQTYGSPALVPASPWMESGAPEAPLANLTARPRGAWELTLATPRSGKPVARWAVWLRFGEQWEFQMCLQPAMAIAAQKSLTDRAPLTGIVVSALDRVGNESARTGLLPLPGAEP
jgi:hypothetical protein